MNKTHSQIKTILVVEDEVPLITSLKIKLERAGYKVLEAMDGEQGLKLALSKHPDLILLDIIMPVMDGITMMNKLREDEWGKTAQLIFLTNLSSEEKELQAKQQGVHDYIIKADWKLEDIIKKISQYFQNEKPEKVA